MARRIYRVYGEGQTVIQVKGDAAAFFQMVSQKYPQAMRSALRHGAYMAQMRLKKEFLQHAPGGEAIKPLSDIQKWRSLDAFKKRRNTYGRAGSDGVKRLKKKNRAYLSYAHGLAWGMSGGKWPVGGKLAQASGYQQKTNTMHASVGWLSKSAARSGAFFQKGQKQRVTKKMRGLFAAAGIILSRGKDTIEQPARPVIEPFFRNRQKWIINTVANYMHTKIRKEADKAMRDNVNKMVGGNIKVG